MADFTKPVPAPTMTMRAARQLELVAWADKRIAELMQRVGANMRRGELQLLLELRQRSGRGRCSR